MRRATPPGLLHSLGGVISIHTLLAESDPRGRLYCSFYAQFLSTLSLRRATRSDANRPCIPCNFYPHSPCGERHDWPPVRDIIQWISIHTLLAESDLEILLHCLAIHNFYPHSPCGERQAKKYSGLSFARFLSTLSLRRATREPTALRTPHQRFLSTLSLRRATCGPILTIIYLTLFLSTLSLRRATRFGRPIDVQLVFLSTLSLRRATVMHALKLANAVLFLSTLSLRRATLLLRFRFFGFVISIHTLLAESDVMHALKLANAVLFLSTLSLRRATLQNCRNSQNIKNFYPHSPCGERPRDEHHANNQQEFLSTLSLRRATHGLPGCAPGFYNFYPHSPCGERPPDQYRR